MTAPLDDVVASQARGSSLTRRQFISRAAGLAVATMASGSILEACSSTARAVHPASPGVRTLSIAIPADPVTLDPAFGNSTSDEIIRNLYAQWVNYKIQPYGIDYRADTSVVVPDAVSSMSITNGGTEIIFGVNGRYLPTGRHLTSSDFDYLVRRAFALKAPGTGFDLSIIGVSSPTALTVVSPNQFRLTLAHPSPILGPILRDQDMGVMDAPVFVEHSTGDPWAKNWAGTHAAATGPYTLQSYQPGVRLVLKRNTRYWGKQGYFDTVNLEVVPSASERSLLLRDGSVDLAESLTRVEKEALGTAPGIRTIVGPSLDQVMLGLLNNKAPFSDLKVRQALAYAVPYQQIVHQVYRGHAEVPKGIWPNSSRYFVSNPWPYRYDLKTAKSLLHDAGMGGGFSFSCQISDSDPDALAIAVILKGALSQIGVTMNVDQVTASVLSTNLSTKSMQSWLQTGLGSYVDNPYYQLYLWYASSAVLNWFGYSNKIIDRLTQQASTITSESGMQALAGKIERTLNDTLPVVVLSDPSAVQVLRSDIGGYLLEPDQLRTYNLLFRR